MTAAKPLARLTALLEGTLASGFATAQLYHYRGHGRAVIVNTRYSNEKFPRVCWRTRGNPKNWFVNSIEFKA